MNEIPDEFKRLLDFEELNHALQPYVESTVIGDFVKHPLVFGPAHPMMNKMLNQQFMQKEREVERAWENQEWASYIWLHERPYRVHALQEIHESLEDEEYWRLAADVWIDSENIWQNHLLWLDILTSERPERHKMMDEDEQAAFAKLPLSMTIYRGFVYEGAIEGLSWTLSLKRAQWFAKRLAQADDTPQVAIAKCSREDVIAYFMGRNEEEILIIPEDIEILSVEIFNDKDQA